MEGLHYLPSELSVPDTVSVEDMDWLALSWNLVGGRKYHTGWPVVQIVVAPGVMLDRMRTSEEKVNPFTFGTPVGSCTRACAEKPGDSATEMAVNYTDKLMGKGYDWECLPFIIDFTEHSLHEVVQKIASIRIPDQPVNTLGDALIHGDDAVLSAIFLHLSSTREKLGC